MKTDHLPDASGIYRITHLSTGRSYIGSAVNIRRRARLHVNELHAGKHPNNKLRNSWGKYGPDAFSISVAELCDAAKLLATEQRYLDEEKPHYNLCPVAGSTLGLKWNAEAKQRAAVAQKLFAAENDLMKAECMLTARSTHAARLRSDNEYRDRWLALRKEVMSKFAREIEFGGVKQTLEAWAKQIGVDKTTLIYRLKNWGTERALTEQSNRGVAHNSLKVQYRGETMSISALAKRLGVNRSSFCEYAGRNGFDAAIRHYETKAA